MTSQEKCVEAKKENSMHEENDVSNRHMTWWRNAWWIRVNSGPHMRTARGRRRIWRAARRAAEQACDDGRVEETLSPAEEVEGETCGRKKREQGRNRREKKTTPCTSCCTCLATQQQQPQQQPQPRPRQQQQERQLQSQQRVCNE